MTHRYSFFRHLKDWWWLYGVGTALCSFIVLWGNMPKRLTNVEAGQAKQAEDIVDLKGIAKKLEGYTDAMNRQQQAPNQAVPRPHGLREWDDTRQVFWCCPLDDRGRCFDDRMWEVCGE